jgi:hypothetical protein
MKLSGPAENLLAPGIEPGTLTTRPQRPFSRQKISDACSKRESARTSIGLSQSQWMPDGHRRGQARVFMLTEAAPLSTPLSLRQECPPSWHRSRSDPTFVTFEHSLLTRILGRLAVSKPTWAATIGRSPKIFFYSDMNEELGGVSLVPTLDCCPKSSVLPISFLNWKERFPRSNWNSYFASGNLGWHRLSSPTFCYPLFSLSRTPSVV